MLNEIIGAHFYESISTPEISIEVQAVHFRRTHFQFDNLDLFLVDVQITESAAFLQRG